MAMKGNVSRVKLIAQFHNHAGMDCSDFIMVIPLKMRKIVAMKTHMMMKMFMIVSLPI